MKEASYGACDTLALKWLKVKATFIHFIGYNFSQPLLICYLQSQHLPLYLFISRSGVPRALPVGINEETRVLFCDKQLLAYICGRDRAVAGRVKLFTTFSDISYDTVKGNIPMKSAMEHILACILFHLAS